MSLTPLLRVAVRKAEKNRFGEVFTPPALINAMLDKLPPSVWTDPTKKWLDPAAGFGNFLSVVYERLMKSLEHVISEPTQRRRHILTQMLYMVEVNPESCARIRENPMFFSNGDNANLSCGSFLDATTTIFPDGTTREFDVIVGNPPFNADQTHEGKKGGGSNLWPKFVEKSLDGDLLKPNGYLLFVHPALWRKPPSDRAKTLFDKMVHDNHMIYLEIHNKLDGKRDFGVQTRYDFYLIQKIRPPPGEDFTMVKAQYSEDLQHGEDLQYVDLSRWLFLPNHSIKLIKPLLTTTEQDYVIFSRCQYGSNQKWVSDKKDERHIYPLVHSTPSSEPRIYWSSKMDDDCKDCKRMFGVPKVIFGESGINDVILDTNGKYGMTQGAIGLKIPVTIDREGEGEVMKRVLESQEFHRILDAMSFSNFRIDWRMFLYLRPDFYRDPRFESTTPFIRPSSVKKLEEPSKTFVQIQGARPRDKSPFEKVKRSKPESTRVTNRGGRKRKYKNSRFTRKKY
jgi:N-6 DNA Methylase